MNQNEELNQSVDLDQAQEQETSNNLNPHLNQLVESEDSQEASQSQPQSPKYEVDPRLDELIKKNYELSSELRKFQEINQKPIESEIKEPTIEECGYDPAVFAKKLKEYIDYGYKRQEKEREVQEYQRRIAESYNKGKSEINNPEFNVAEAIVSNILNQNQISMLLEGAENPAKLVYALGKDTEKLKKLASINNPAQFISQFVRMEESLKANPFMKKKVPPSPDEPMSPTSSQGSDSELERIRALAEKSGDYTKVLNYKRKLRRMK